MEDAKNNTSLSFGALLLLLFSAGVHSQILVSVDPNIVQSGADFTVTCRVTNIPPGDTVTWKKRQEVDTEKHEDVIGYGSQTAGAYKDVGRFSIARDIQGTDVIFMLNVRNAVYEDSGDYACVNVDSVTPDNQPDFKTVSVAAPVSELTLETYNDRGDPTSLEDGAPLNIREGQEGHFGCTAIGGNPAPEVTVHLEDEKDLTDKFERTEKQVLTRPISDSVRIAAEAMNRISYEVTLKSIEPLKVKQGQGELLARKRLICTAKVPGQAPFIKSIQLVFKLAPKVNCTDLSVREGGKAKLHCTIRSDPMPDTIVFTWKNHLDKTNISIKPGEIDGEHHFQRLEDGAHGGEKIAILEIRHVTKSTFNDYYLEATNEMGTSSAVARLTRDAHTLSSDNGSELARCSPVVIFMLLSAAIFRRV